MLESSRLIPPPSVQANWQLCTFIGLVHVREWIEIISHANGSQFGCAVLHTAVSSQAGWFRSWASSLWSGGWHVARDFAIWVATSQSGVCGLSASPGAVNEIKEPRRSLWSLWNGHLVPDAALTAGGKQGAFELLHFDAFKWITAGRCPVTFCALIFSCMH